MADDVRRTAAELLALTRLPPNADAATKNNAKVAALRLARLMNKYGLIAVHPDDLVTFTTSGSGTREGRGLDPEDTEIARWASKHARTAARVVRAVARTPDVRDSLGEVAGDVATSLIRAAIKKL